MNIIFFKKFLVNIYLFVRILQVWVWGGDFNISLGYFEVWVIY